MDDFHEIDISIEEMLSERRDENEVNFVWDIPENHDPVISCLDLSEENLMAEFERPALETVNLEIPLETTHQIRDI
ncbi:hypothetical protein R5R35_006622 [Gryllus longicercus]|uniref:Uncharacterized protein n=1 Tax=Gryllus longicercus TaxID=2509291 RepID=A0AAN9VUR8_9ORTH